jgi:hypothetical protein
MDWTTWGLNLRRGKRLFSQMNRPALGPTQLPIERAPRAFSSGVKWSGDETDHSFLTIVKIEWSYTSALCIFLHGMYRDDFTFYCENFPSVRRVSYVQMLCRPILFLPHVADSVGRVVILLLVVVGVVAEVVTVVILGGGAGGVVALVLLFVVVIMTVVITVVVVLVKVTFCAAWNIVKI